MIIRTNLQVWGLSVIVLTRLALGPGAGLQFVFFCWQIYGGVILVVPRCDRPCIRMPGLSLPLKEPHSKIRAL